MPFPQESRLKRFDQVIDRDDRWVGRLVLYIDI